MNFLFKDYLNYLNQLLYKFENENLKTVLGIAVPYIYLEKTSQLLGSKINVIAQDIHHMSEGSFTSSISAQQLESININWTLIGHSECRLISQNSEIIKKKVEQAIRFQLNVVYCCGANPIEEIENELFPIKKLEFLNKLIIAYEPIDAIGSGNAMDSKKANEVCQKIKELIFKKWGQNSSKVKVLYGGSVDLKNYKKYLEENHIDGVLVGKASMNIDDFWKMTQLHE